MRRRISCNGKTLAKNAKYCNTLFSKMKGLMFTLPSSAVLVADEETKILSSIHMMFVFYSIDVVWLNRKKEIVDIKRNVKPFTINHSPRKPAKYIVEIPKGAAKGLKHGMTLKF